MVKNHVKSRGLFDLPINLVEVSVKYMHVFIQFRVGPTCGILLAGGQLNELGH